MSDNHALYQSLKGDLPVLPIFIFDSEILEKIEDKSDGRVSFIHENLEKINRGLGKHHSSLRVFVGKPKDVFSQLLDEFEVCAIYTNRDYEPYALERDIEVKSLVEEKGSAFKDFKDQVIFEKDDVLKDDGTPYTVYTPYMKKWKSLYDGSMISSFPVEKFSDNFFESEEIEIPSLESFGFRKSEVVVPDYQLSNDMLASYKQVRDIPSSNGTSHLSTYLRFGVVGVRQVIREIGQKNETFLNELIWREFFSQILWHFPHVLSGSFRRKYDFIEWRNNEEEFKKWCEGKTGFPIVDAGMRELNQTGLMHNRVRMIVASFLVKDLLIDWRWGEAYFANKLLDFELASNNGNWQWAAGTGCDAAPYFRVFNPTEQTKKFDPNRKYIEKWIPEIDSSDYSEPIVDHKFARDRALKTYKKALTA